MSRRRKPDNPDAGASRFQRIRDELVEATGLELTPATALRLDQAAWIKMAQQNTQAAILNGKPISPADLQAFTDALNSILPRVETLTVRFVDPPQLCDKCAGQFAEASGA